MVLPFGFFEHGITFPVYAQGQIFNEMLNTILGGITGAISIVTTILFLRRAKILVVSNALLCQTGVYYLIRAGTHCILFVIIQ